MLQLFRYSLWLWLFIKISSTDLEYDEMFPNPRIINSVHATRFPFMASIHLLVDGKEVEVCTGAIVHRLYVITSSTCIYDITTKNPNYTGYVRVGTFNLSRNGTVYNFSAIFQHPLYDHFQKRHDIALVHLSSPITFTDHVQIIDINIKYIRGGKRVMTAGWGPYDSHTSGFSEELRWIADETSNVFQCVDKIRFTGQSVAQLHWDETLCIKNLPRGGMCRSDYGAPLIMNKTLIGVFSWGPENCTTENKFPYVFTRTSFYGQFINSYLKPK